MNANPFIVGILVGALLTVLLLWVVRPLFTPETDDAVDVGPGRIVPIDSPMNFDAVRAQFDHYIIQRNEARDAGSSNLASYLDGVLDGLCLTLTYSGAYADLGLELQKAKTDDSLAWHAVRRGLP